MLIRSISPAAHGHPMPRQTGEGFLLDAAEPLERPQRKMNPRGRDLSLIAKGIWPERGRLTVGVRRCTTTSLCFSLEKLQRSSVVKTVSRNEKCVTLSVSYLSTQ